MRAFYHCGLNFKCYTVDFDESMLKMGMKEMRLNQLEYLLAVAREGSYQNAAKRLEVSQSTISVAIKNGSSQKSVGIQGPW